MQSHRLFAYPEPLKEVVEEKKERVATAVLSITSKAKAKEAKKKKGTSGEMDVDPPKEPKDDKTESSKEEKEKEEAANTPEPDSFDLSNPCRVTYSQQSFISIISDQRYRPVRKDFSAQSNLGVLLLTDSTPTEDDKDLRDIKAPPMIGDDGPEPDPPEPFEWIPPEYRN